MLATRRTATSFKNRLRFVENAPGSRARRDAIQPLSSFALQQLSAISRVADHSAVPAERPALPTQQPAAPIALIPKANGSARRSSALQLRWGLRQYIPRRGRVTESASTRRLALSSPPFAAPRPSAIGREYEPADRP